MSKQSETRQRIKAAAERHTPAFQARVLALAEEFAGGGLRPSELGLWADAADRAIGRWGRHNHSWLEILHITPAKTLTKLLVMARSDLSEEVAALGPRHAAHVEWLWQHLAKTVVLAAVIARHVEQSAAGTPDATKLFKAILAHRTSMQVLKTVALHRRWVDSTPLLEEVTGRSIKPRLRVLDRAFRAAIARAWSAVAEARELPPITLRGAPGSPWIGRWQPNAWPQARLEIRVDAIAGALEAIGHPRLESASLDDLSWGWDPCLFEAYLVASMARMLDPVEMVIHETFHAADAWDVGKWKNDTRGIPAILVTMGFVRLWLSADQLTVREAKNGQLLTPWSYESFLYEGWTTARALILAPQVRASIAGLPVLADFEALKTPKSRHPYASSTALFRRLFNNEELMSFDAPAIRAAFLERIRVRLGAVRADAIERILNEQMGPIALRLPAKLKVKPFWEEFVATDPVYQAVDEIFAAMDPATGGSEWSPVLAWLDEADRQAAQK